jgi:hypothetical protein
MTRPSIVVLIGAICGIIFLASHRERPLPPSRMVEVPYCVVDRRVAGKDELGRWHFAWGEMYSPCSEQDRFVDA